MKRLLLLFGMVSCWISVSGQLTAPFLETFNGSSTPSGWTNNTSDPWKFSGTMGYDASIIGDHTGTSGSWFAWVDGSGTAYANTPLTTDSINMAALTNPELTFFLSSYNPSYVSSNGSNTFSVDFYDGSTWHDSVYVHAGSFPGWQRVVVNLTSYTISGKCLVRFNVNTTTASTAFYNDIAIDDVRVANQPTCPQPSNLTSSGTTSSSATLSWVSGGATSWQVEYGAPGYTPGTGTQVLTTSNTNYALTGLSPATTYDIWVRDYCSATDQSFWVGPVTVTTQCVNTLSGSYTLNQGAASSATNFTSFGDLATSLNTCGVTGPVTVNVVTGSGPYYEGVEFGAITGASSTNTVTINGNGEALIDSGATNPNNAALLLNGTDHMTIDSLSIMAWGSSNRMGLQFTNEADSNTIRNCMIEVDPNATSSSVVALGFSGSTTSSTTYGDNGDYNLIEGNTIRGGYYCVRHTGSSTTSPIVGNRFIGNTIQDFYVYGLYSYYAENAEIRDNDINRLNRGTVTTCYSMYCGYLTENTEISGNWIHDVFAQATGSTSTFYGIYCFGSDASTGNEVKVYNNLFSDNGNGGTHYVLYNSGSDGWWYYHNTVVENSPSTSGSGSTRVFYQTGTASNIEFKNNLMYMDRGTTGANYMVYLNSTTSGIAMDYNAYYMPQAGGGTFNFGYYSGNVADFTAWQAVNSGAFDQNSAEGDPFFVDPATYDYTPGAAYFNDIGTNLSGIVATDITGALRSTTPDPGAYEFSPPPGPDMSVSNIYSGGASCGTSTSILVEVLNQGTDSVTSFTVNYTIDGVAQTGISVTGLFRTGDFDTVSISGIPISGTAITSVVVTLDSIAPGTDTDVSNNTDSIQMRAGLSGTYTLNSGAAASTSNFVSFSSLAQALNTYGVCGNVTVNVVSTVVPYYEQFYLNEISGVSSSATVTINGNGNTLEYLATDGSARATVILNGTDWVTIDSLTINALGTTTSEYGFGVSLTNNADHNTIRNCDINVEDDLSSSNYAGITISGSLSSATSSGMAGNYNLIENNTITGGYYGVTSYGQSSDSLIGNQVINNEVGDFYYYGIYSYYNNDLVVDGNDVHRMNRQTLSSMYGIYAYYTGNGKIVNNRIHDAFVADPTLTSSFYGIYAYQLNGTASDSAIIGNNMIYNIEHDGYVYALYPNTISFTKVIHNTVVIVDPNNTTTSTFYRAAALYAPGSIGSSTIANNLFYMDRDNPGDVFLAYLGTSGASGAVMDNNSYYNPGNFTASFGYANGSTVATFAAWQSATGADANSVNQDPYFVNLAGGNYTPQSALLDGGGIDFSGLLPRDITGAVRGTNPDMGAIEFVGAPCTGLSQIGTTNVTASGGTIVWKSNPAAVTIEWGPTGYKQASQTPDSIVNVTLGDTSLVIAGLSALNCYDYYLTMNCTSSIPGAPPVMGPFQLCTDCASGPLSGTYTVGGTAGPTNFPTLDSVVTALNGCGINAPVIFNMMGGTHNAISLGQIDGSSAVNTITFNGSAGYGDSIVAIGQTAAIDLDGAEHITFNDLYVENSSGNRVVWLHNSADHMTFDNCQLIGDRAATSSATGVLVATGSPTSISGSGDNASDLTVTNCLLAGNYYGFSVYGGGTTAKTAGYNISNNTFEDIYAYVMRFYYCDSVIAHGNQNLNGTRATFGYGIYSYYSDNVSYQENAFYGLGTYGMYVYYSNYSNADPASSSVIANNMIQSTGTAGIYAYGDFNTSFYHNSIQGGSSYGFYLSGPANSSYDNIDIRNNIIEMTGSGRAFYLSAAPANLTLDYNIYNSGGDVAYSLGTSYSTLAAWQSADTVWNQNSFVALPGFISSSDFHIVGTAPNDTGDNSVGILTDIDGDPRPASGSSTVDIGADEFTPLVADAAIVDILSPSGCGSTTTEIALVFQNLGLNNITAATATVNVTGSVTATLNGTYSGNLASLGTDTVIVGTINTFNGGTISLDGEIILTGDQDASNDTMTLAGGITFIPTEPQFYTPDTVCVNQDSATFAAVSYTSTGTRYGWYANSTDTVPAAVGDSFKFSVSGQNTWYLGYLGNSDSLVTTYAAGNGQAGNAFDITTLRALDITGFSLNIDNTSPHQVLVYYRLGGYAGFNTSLAGWTLIDSVNTVGRGTGVPTPCMFSNPLSLSGNQLYSFMVVLTTGTNLDYTNGSTTGAIFAQNSDMIFYEGAGISWPLGSDFNPRVFNGAIHYTGDACSNVKKTVTLVTGTDTSTASFTSVDTDPTFNFDASASTNADGYVWDFGDGSPLGSGVTTSHKYTVNGTYTVTLCVIDTSGCISTACDSTVIQVDSVGISLEENLLSNSLVVYPNPSSGIVNVKFVTADSDKVTISVSDLSGKEVLRLNKDALNGKFDGAIDISKLADGTYMLKISNSEMTAIRRLIKQ